ncbi:MAG TPA: MgtC/SapB family protein [Candidatus Omnitrophica bacterium]|nr:MgtC/SapB family protein [Candidatus Omnitrophota bacterium]
MNNWVILIRVFLSVILGGIIGFERSKKGRPAGLRTHILVAMGSCLIMVTSLYIYELYKGKAPLDPARIAAGVVTGIGFLGAGTIIRSPQEIKGLTTAASIWVSAGIGLAIGCGLYFASFLTTILTFGTLFYLRKIETTIEIKKLKSSDNKT